MTDEELEEITRLLEEQGWQPRACDVEVPVYGNRVPCGQPTDVGDVLVERHLSLPHAIVRNIKAYVIVAKGNSMEDMGIHDGDEVLVELCDTASDNEAQPRIPSHPCARGDGAPHPRPRAEGAAGHSACALRRNTGNHR